MSTAERTRTLVHRTGRPEGRASRLARPGWLIMTAFSVLVAVVASRYLIFDSDLYFAEQRTTYVRHEVALGVHVACGVLALLTGPVQFLGRLRRRFTRLHRVTGAVYTAGATGLALSGLVLAPTAYTGRGATWGFALLGLATLVTTWAGLRAALAGQYADHRRWMVRSFALVLGGVMLRVLIGVYLVLSALGLVDATFETAYATITWLCWVPNLLVALWVTRRPAHVMATT